MTQMTELVEKDIKIHIIHLIYQKTKGKLKMFSKDRKDILKRP